MTVPGTWSGSRSSLVPARCGSSQPCAREPCSSLLPLTPHEVGACVWSVLWEGIGGSVEGTPTLVGRQGGAGVDSSGRFIATNPN